MVTRYTIPQPPPGTYQLPNGYSTDGTQPSDYTIPSCGIEDVDRAVFDLLDSEMPFSAERPATNNGANGAVNIKKPTVIFATGERFAIVKKLKPVRDRNGALMLPAISIRRTAIEQTYQDMSSRGMNQTTGELVIKRQLSSEDRNYQNIINKVAFKNQNSSLTTRRATGEEANSESNLQGIVLDPKIGNNIIETISIPQPQFFTATYEVVFWTNFTEQMNYMIESFLAAQLPQGKYFKLVTKKGYWFMAHVDENIQSQGNIDDFTETERILRYSFNLRVEAYILAGAGPGMPVPVKRFVSAPQFSFKSFGEVPESKKQIENSEGETADRFLLSDIELDPTAGKQPSKTEQYLLKRTVKNPITGKEVTRFVKIKNTNSKRGETVYSASDPQILEEYLASIKGKR